MIFNLELFDTKNLGKLDNLDESVGEAIETIYSMEDTVLMIWDGVPIKLSLKYDIGDIWNDIIEMLRAIRTGNDTKFAIHWPSNTFFAQWDFQIKESTLEIEAHWMSVSGGREKLEALRSAKSKIVINKMYYISIWRNLLRKIDSDLKKAGYSRYQLQNYDDLIAEL